MLATRGMAVKSATASFEPFQFNRREPGPHDVQIEIAYCGICHSDIHQSRDEWGGAIFPMVPGHEIVGHVKKVGNKVSKFKEGDIVGVGCFVDSCRECDYCKRGDEVYCAQTPTSTYNGIHRDSKEPTYGGYANQIVVDENFVLRVSPKLELSRVAPLLCAGITTYSPLKHWKIGKGHKLAVAGLGGLGHMAVKLAAALGAEVTVISTSPAKAEDAKRLGAHHFANVNDAATKQKLMNQFDFIINTVSAPTVLSEYIEFLKVDGTMIMLGVASKAAEVSAPSLIRKRRSIAGSLVGGIQETQEMLDFCAAHNIMSDIEIISAKEIEMAYARMMKSDVKYRFVIDMKTL